MPSPFPDAPDGQGAVGRLPGWAAEAQRVWGAFVLEYQQGDRVVGGRLVNLAGRQRKGTLVTAASYTILRTDDIIDVNFAGAVALTLPLNPFYFQEWSVQDSSGAASSNTISLSPPGGINLNGGSSAVALSTDYGRLRVIYNGTQFIAA